MCLFTLSNFPLTSLFNFASRLFAAVEKAGATSLLVSQGMSTSAISIAVAEDQTEQVVAYIVETFKHDSEDYGSQLQLSVDTECSILSVVGRGQVSFVGALGKRDVVRYLFKRLGVRL